MGAGKTTVGRLLARRLARAVPTIPTTRSSAAPACSIPVIFEIEGEAGFRAREAQVIDELTRARRRRARHRRRRGARRGQPRASSRRAAWWSTCTRQPARPVAAHAARQVTGRCCDRRSAGEAGRAVRRSAIRCTARSPTSSSTPAGRACSALVAPAARATARNDANSPRSARRARLPDPHRRGPARATRDLYRAAPGAAARRGRHQPTVAPLYLERVERGAGAARASQPRRGRSSRTASRHKRLGDARPRLRRAARGTAATATR